ncbi:MAG: zinc-ribbon domain-containing protein [Promethearchaeota archaeon]|nr:MAG: zinc-ribbon domain-containing protein [Candidatus Lokiarchaeota archaeon]
MTNNNYDRHYRKEKYESAIGAFGVGLVFLFVAILSLLFLALDIDFIGLKGWGFWMFIPAFFIILGGFSQLYTNYKYKKDVRSALADRNYQGTHKLENLALEVGIKPSDLLQILIDLRQSGEIRYKFNPDSGEIVLGQRVQYQPSPEFKEEKAPKKEIEPEAPRQVSVKKNFCPYCGHQIRKGSKFCENCGSEL